MGGIGAFQSPSRILRKALLFFMFICIVWGGENLLLFQYKCLPFLSSCKQSWWTAEDNMGFQALTDLCEEKLWLMWNLHGPLDGRKLICLVFVHFTKMAA